MGFNFTGRGSGNRSNSPIKFTFSDPNYIPKDVTQPAYTKGYRKLDPATDSPEDFAKYSDGYKPITIPFKNAQNFANNSIPPASTGPSLRVPSPSIPSPRMLPAHQIADNNPIVGEKYFLTNTFPIRQNDNPLIKGLKGVGNVVTSAISAPGEALRQFSIQGDSVLKGRGLRRDLPKNTTFTQDILPKGATNAVNNFSQSHPTLGGLAQMGLETVADPTTYIGGNAIKSALTPQTEKALLKPPLPVWNNKLSPIEFPKNELSKPVLPKLNRYTLNTGEQKAAGALNEGVQTVQNYIGHNDILAAYPPGTTIERALADIKLKTGVDLPRLADDFARVQSEPNKLSEIFPVNPQKSQLLKASGAYSDLRLKKPNIPKLEGPELPSTIPFNTLNKIAQPQSRGLTRVIEPLKNPKALPGVAKELAHSVYTTTVDKFHPMSRANKEVAPQSILDDTHKLSLLTNNAQGTVKHILNSSLVDRTGKEIGEGWQSIVKDIPQKLEREFNDYLLHKHNIARYGNKKPVFGNGVNTETSARAVAEYEAAHPEFKDLSKRINTLLNNVSDAWGVDGGLVEQGLMKSLREIYPDYVPTYRQSEAPTLSQGTGRVGPAKIIKTAVGGNEKIVPPTESIPLLINKLVTNARKNEAYQGLLNAVRKNPESMKKYAELTKPDEELAASMAKTAENYGVEGAAEVNPLIEHPTKGRFLTVMENGKPVTLKINDADYWNALKEVAQPRQAGAIEAFGRKITQPFKNVVTGYNPFFAINNAARDLSTYAINSIENNPAFAGINVKDALKDIVTGSKDFKEFVALGGAEGNFFKNTTGLTKYNPINKVGDFNNLVEIIPRYAEYLATVKKGGGSYESKLQGIYNASEVTTNFGRHGNLTKTIDSWVPYLNPAVQGLDKFARQAVLNPVPTIAKGVATVTVPTTALYAINQAFAKDAYDQLDNRTKDTYFLIPKGDGTFFKLPKSREAGVLFGSFFERLYNKASGKDETFKGFGNTVATNFAPQNPLENNIWSPLITNLPANKDFANRTIVPQSLQGLSPALQYDEKTSEIAKAIGEKFNMSPKQIDYLAKSYLGVIGQYGVPAATKHASVLDPFKQRFTADPLYSNDITDTFYNTKNKIAQGKADAKATGEQSRAVGTQWNSYFNNTADQMSNIRKVMNKIQSDHTLSPEDKQARLREFQVQMLQLAREANNKYKLK